MTDMEETLQYAEKQRERLAAIIRVFVFLALLAAVLSIRSHGGHHHPILGVTIAYGILATIGFLFAWRGIFHPALPIVFVTLEVMLVGGQTILMGSLMGQPPLSLSALPVAAVIFVILAHAAMRYRPWLVVYAAILFISMMALAGRFLPTPVAMPVMSQNQQHDIVHHQIFPLIMIILSAGILFVTARGTRRLLNVSISERIARHRLSRFFAPDIAKRLIDQSNGNEAGGAVQPVSILFTDIRGFSSIAEKLTPVELTDLLGEFREIMAEVIQEHGGVVDKFIGDAVMAVFGFPKPDGASPARCLASAQAMLERLRSWSEQRTAVGHSSVTIGIGIHYGEAFVGVVGQADLLEFTVIGDTVNIAERVERMTRPLDADIAVSRAFAEAAGLDPHAHGWIFSPAQQLEGRSRLIDVFSYRRNAA